MRERIQCWARAGAAAAAVVLLASAALAQSEELKRGPHRMEISLDRYGSDGWDTVDPGFVFEPQDRVRFRLNTNFGGYLYVLNTGTSGDYTLLFPREETGRENRIEANREYLIPATKGAFRITGPPGHEIVYWLVSPVEIDAGPGGPPYTPLPDPPKPEEIPPRLEPRCDDTIFRARGDCVDTSAGLQRVEEGETLPENLAGVPRMQSRQLLFLKKKKSSVVSAPPKLEGPVIFEFRLAHR